MELVVKELGYKLTPHSGGLCYELHEWKEERTASRGKHAGESVAAGWAFTGQYPSTIASGLATMFDRAILADKSVLTSVESAVKRIKEIRNTIVLEAKWEDDAS